MTETTDAPAPLQGSGSFLGNLFNLYFEPAETFARIFNRPRLILAIALQVALATALVMTWAAKTDAHEFFRQQLEQSPFASNMPQEQVKTIIDRQAAWLTGGGRFVFPLIGLIALPISAGFFLFIFRFFMAHEVSFRQSLAVVTWVFLAVGVVTIPISLAIYGIRGDWNIPIEEVIQANPTVLFERDDVSTWLWSLMSSLDLFSFWRVFLLATGYAAAAKRSLGSALWGVGVPWMLYVAAKVGFRMVAG